MKKFLSIGIGAVLVVSAVVPFVNASRDAYHAYVQGYAAFGTYNPHSDDFGRYTRVNGIISPSTYRKATLYNGAPYIKRDRFYTLQLPYRPTTYTRGYINRNRGTRGRDTIRLGRARENYNALETYKEAEFSIQLPQGSIRQEGEGFIFFQPEKNYKVTIKHYSPDFCSDIQGFYACAIKVSKNENRIATDGDSENIATTRIVRQSTYSDTVLDTRIQTRIYTESFATTLNYQSEEQYINRYIVADTDGSIFLVETVTPVQGASNYIALSKRIFDSFRIYPH
jgi:hypothetical protein